MTEIYRWTQSTNTPEAGDALAEPGFVPRPATKII